MDTLCNKSLEFQTNRPAEELAMDAKTDQPVVTIGMGQLLVEGGEPERNLDRAAEMIEDAASQGCDIVLLPECLDLAWTHDSCRTQAQPIPGIYSDRICRLAQEFQIHICCGLTECYGNSVFNTAILVDDCGEILLKYRKINVLEIAREMYQTGQSLSVIDTRFGKIGVNICSDNCEKSLDIGSVLARMGAQLILSPSSWTTNFYITEVDDPYGKKWIGPYRTLAELFNLVIINATSVGTIVGGPYQGKKMVGCSLAVGPNGVLAQGDYNEFSGELVVVTFSMPQLRSTGTLIDDVLTEAGKIF